VRVFRAFPRATAVSFPHVDDSPLKRKRAADDDDDVRSDPELDAEADVEMADADAEDDEGQDYKGKKAASAKAKVAKEKAPKSTPAKKPRVVSPVKKPRARKVKGEVDVTKLAKETNIADDNPLFSTYPTSYLPRSRLYILRRNYKSCHSTPDDGRRLFGRILERLGSCPGRPYHMLSSLLWV
jgi:hypothetical protein